MPFNSRFVATACLALSFSMIFCELTDPGDGNESVQLEQLKFEDNEVSGWALGGRGYIPFNSSNMFGLVNGGADIYINGGLLEGFEQNMDRAGTAFTFRMWIMDFGTAEKATEMYNSRKDEFTTREAAGSLSEDVAFIDASGLYGRDGYAHFGKYVIQIAFSGYSGKLNQAKDDAIGFLEAIKAKL